MLFLCAWIKNTCNIFLTTSLAKLFQRAQALTFGQTNFYFWKFNFTQLGGSTVIPDADLWIPVLFRTTTNIRLIVFEVLTCEILNNKFFLVFENTMAEKLYFPTL